MILVYPTLVWIPVGGDNELPGRNEDVWIAHRDGVDWGYCNQYKSGPVWWATWANGDLKRESPVEDVTHYCRVPNPAPPIIHGG